VKLDAKGSVISLLVSDARTRLVSPRDSAVLSKLLESSTLRWMIDR